MVSFLKEHFSCFSCIGFHYTCFRVIDTQVFSIHGSVYVDKISVNMVPHLKLNVTIHAVGMPAECVEQAIGATSILQVKNSFDAECEDYSLAKVL